MSFKKIVWKVRNFTYKDRDFLLRITPYDGFRLGEILPDGRVALEMCFSDTDEGLRQFLDENWEEVLKVFDLYKDKKNYTIHGRNYYIWGKKYKVNLIFSNLKKYIEIKNDELIFYVKPKTSKQEQENILFEHFRVLLKREIESLVAECEAVAGVHAKEWRTKKMRTVWGTCCIRAKRIWLNLHLISYNKECLRYVMLHELTHLLEKNHTKVFDAYMDKFMPDWREVKKLLNIVQK
ncbi:DUF45 domain-containing protein [bacterium]|nr:DUF45 domain-containing protein [bacterium]